MKEALVSLLFWMLVWGSWTAESHQGRLCTRCDRMRLVADRRDNYCTLLVVREWGGFWFCFGW